MKISPPLNLGLPGNQHSEAEKENAYRVKKKTAKKHPHPGPSPQRSMCKEKLFLNYFITIIIIFLQASNSSFSIIHNCVSR